VAPRESLTLGPYVVLSELGRGSFGSVYLAKHESLGRQVALKVVLASRLDPEGLARFKREARLASRIVDPCVVSVFDVGEQGDAHYYAMEYCRGPTLRERLRQGPLEPETAVELVAELARALQALHDAAIIHRDLKPANILLEEGTGRPRLTDFGLAHDGAHAQRLTHTGEALGTPHFMSPEQFRGEPADARADVYALGAILYECLSGSRLYDATTVVALSKQVLHGPPPPPLRARAPHLDADLEAICSKATAGRRRDRYASAAELQRSLEAYLERGRQQRAAPPGMRRVPRLAVKPAALVLGLVGLALLLGVGLVWLAHGRAQATREAQAKKLQALLDRAASPSSIAPAAARGEAREALEGATRLAGDDPEWRRHVETAREQLARSALERARALLEDEAEGERVQAALDHAEWLAQGGPLSAEVQGERRRHAARGESSRAEALARQLRPREEVQAALERAREAGAGHADLVAAVDLVEARLAFARGAFEACEQAARRTPGSEAGLLLALVLLETGRQEGERLLEELARADPGLVGLSAKARLAMLRGDAAGGVRAAGDALRQDPDHVPTLITLGWLELYEGRRHEAQQAFDRARELAPHHWLPHWSIGLSAFHQGRYQDAYEPLGRVIDLTQPEPYWPAFFYRARVFLNMRPHGDWQSVVARFEGTYPDHPAVHVLRGYSIWLYNRLDDARAEWLKAVELDEDLAWDATHHLAPKGRFAMIRALEGVSSPTR
jgi:tetratricopeptide (TPR) repeat protein